MHFFREPSEDGASLGQTKRRPWLEIPNGRLPITVSRPPRALACAAKSKSRSDISLTCKVCVRVSVSGLAGREALSEVG